MCLKNNDKMIHLTLICSDIIIKPKILVLTKHYSNDYLYVQIIN